MGIRSLLEMNKALHGKWLSRYLDEEGRLWKRIVEVRWGRWKGRAGWNVAVGKHGSGLWRSICAGGEKWSSCIKWKLGRGNKIIFWEDVWTDGGCLKERFPRIYALAQNKNMTVEAASAGERSGGDWEVAVTRNLNDWEVEEYESLLLIQSNLWVLRDEDKLIWKPKKNGVFLVKSYYEILLGLDDD